MSDVETIRVRGEGGVVWTVDVTDRVREQLAKGQLVEVDDQDRPVVHDEPTTDEPSGDVDLTTANVAEVLAWVGDDPERAAEALTVETGDDGKGRSTLVAALEAILGKDDD